MTLQFIGGMKVKFHTFLTFKSPQKPQVSHSYLGNTRTVWKVRGLTLLFRVGTLWKCGDSLFFEVPPFASVELLKTLHSLLENVLRTVDHFEIPCLLRTPFSWLEKPWNRRGRDVDCMADVLMGFHWSNFSKLNTEFNSDLCPMRFLGFSNHEKGALRQEILKWPTVCSMFPRSGWSTVRSTLFAKWGTSKKRPSLHLHKVPTQSNKVSPNGPSRWRWDVSFTP
jgi:hypothetical protein